jgi:predicted transcriptional regulator
MFDPKKNLMEKKELVLSLIQKNDGRWTWYQLARALTVHGYGGQGNVVTFMNELVKEGLILTKIAPNYQNPLYCMTAQGRNWLENHKARKAA